ncbi:MAG: vanadium-dependent haloperoxidase [Alphaproteobacteria bacterium]|nr:vanadium-dependent haloperoxidase [Alphaproteobacteria bacterium]
MMPTIKYKYVILLFSISILSCQQKTDNSNQIFANPALYNQAVFDLNWVVMGNNFSPIVASRNYAYASIAAYEAMIQGYPNTYQSLVGQLHQLNRMYRCPDTSKVNFNLAAIWAFCNVGESVTFPQGSMGVFKDSILKLAQIKGMQDFKIKATTQFADSVSAYIIAWSRLDNYAQTRTMEKYNINSTAGRWVPTPPGYFEAAEPNWKLIRPFTLDSAQQFKAPPPISFDMKNKKGAFYKQVMDIKNITEHLTEEQKHIADFWDDNPFKLNVIGHIMFANKKFSPPGHWMNIVGIASTKAHFSFDETVMVYASASITMFDAFIHTWDVKYKYSTARPETIINKYIDPSWRPYLQTPPFPEYTCGHSTISAAIAETLTHVFGDHFNFTDSSEVPFGIKPRQFKSFRDAALENNLARFYGGIHFHPSCLISTDMGSKVGQFVTSRLKLKK